MLNDILNCTGLPLTLEVGGQNMIVTGSQKGLTW